MNRILSLKYYILTNILLISITHLNGQTEIDFGYSVNEKNQVQLEIQSAAEFYYVLRVRHDSSSSFDILSSITLGQEGTTNITEGTHSYPKEHYQITQYAINNPADTDGDGIDDIIEYNNVPTQSPLNAAPSINAEDGYTSLDDFTRFRSLSVTNDIVLWSEFLNGKVFVKYIINDFHTDQPKVYFIHSDNHNLHADFAQEIGIDHLGDQVKKGQVIYHPDVISPNGTLGSFVFNYSNGHGDDFEVVQRTYELLAANMFFLENNLSYFITERNEDEYERDKDLFEASRIPILFESEVYADIDYWGLHGAEGYGLFRHMDLEEIPGPKDIVLYDALPNSLPRVGGIMTSVTQTPLSHVNLRAIQDDIPNAFIRDPLAIDSVAALLDKLIYYRVEQDRYFMREASVDEVNAWYEDIRPKEEQIPLLNLEYQNILPLDSISFDMNDGYGSKCANVAVMRSFGFPEGTTPDGFGIPFYFYQEFMKYNNFFEEVESIINTDGFLDDRELRDDLLNDFRKKIKDAPMPPWMLDELEDMQDSFAEGISIRCRSSTNNEDLPGFSGAGLYDSKTQHPDEGHISKSVKQVYASLWNLRAFDERDFFRVNHQIASMGILCHPNYPDEQANGVGVSTDPIYNTDNTFYLNTQVGEDLITNPDFGTIPEEILLDRESLSDNDYIVIQRSSLLEGDTLIMSDDYLDQMRDYLTTIHDEFAVLYNATDDDNFAMDIEYKITNTGQLIIKQARPWAAFSVSEEQIDPEDPEERLKLLLSPNPATSGVSIDCIDCNVDKWYLLDMAGKIIAITDGWASYGERVRFYLSSYPKGVYVIRGESVDGKKYAARVIKL